MRSRFEVNLPTSAALSANNSRSSAAARGLGVAVDLAVAQQVVDQPAAAGRVAARAHRDVFLVEQRQPVRANRRANRRPPPSGGEEDVAHAVPRRQPTTCGAYAWSSSGGWRGRSCRPASAAFAAASAAAAKTRKQTSRREVGARAALALVGYVFSERGCRTVSATSRATRDRATGVSSARAQRRLSEQRTAFGRRRRERRPEHWSRRRRPPSIVSRRTASPSRA